MNYPYITDLPKPPRRNIWLLLFILALIFLVMGWMGRVKASEGGDKTSHPIWMGIIAEDTSGDYQTYLCIASVVRNRLAKGMNTGLVALKRKDLDDFIAEQYLYVLKTKNKDLQMIAQFAILKIFEEKLDYVNGATNYEHTRIYPVPSYTKNMKIVKVLYKGQKREITFWREK